MRFRFLLAFFVLASPLAAQVESPVPFDSAGQMMTMSPATAQRLQLTAPAWPVVGTFREARVFLAGAERFVLVVERPDGARERFPLSAPQYEALRGAVSSGQKSAAPARPAAGEAAPRMGGTGQAGRAGFADDDMGDVSRPAFTARMMLAAVAIYGPAAAIIVDEPAGSTAAFLGVVSGSFFASYAATRAGVSRAQSALASDFAIRGAGAGWLFADALNMTDSKERATGVFLIGLGSTIAGYHLAKPLTLAEVSSMTFGSTAAGLTAWGLLAATGSLDEARYSRNDAATILVAGAAGLPLGLAYHRIAPHYISSGDTRAIGAMGALGALTGITIASRFRQPNDKGGAAAATAGFVGGVVAGDMFLARNFDHTRGEGFLLGLGTLAGALAGAAPFVIADAEEPRKWLVGATLGAALGAWGTTVLSNPARGTMRTALSPGRSDRPRLAMHPVNAVLAATRTHGTFPLLTLAF